MGVRITRVMNLVAVVVLLATTISLVQSGAASQGIADLMDGHGAASVTAPGTAESPDIYVILLDGYPGSDARALLPEYPASRLASGLRQRGFDMAADTHSNYLTTSVTLASMFQMQHLADLPELAPPWGPDAADARRLRRLINDGSATQAFRDAGYRTIGIASGFAEVELRNVDRLIEPIEPTEFEISLLRGTGVGNLLEAVTPDVMPALQRGRIGDTLQAIRQVASEPAQAPRLVFAHVPAPHAPWVFGPDGSGRRASIFQYYVDSAKLRGIDRKVALQHVLDQAAYLDGQVLDVIDGILADSPRPPVIVVFSDHGPGTGYQEADLADSDLVERSSNILAAFTPGHPGLFAQPTTPITIFPRLLDTYLGQDVPIPDDSTWAWGDSILDLHEIDVDNAP
jgi:hypothetical protein